MIEMKPEKLFSLFGFFLATALLLVVEQTTWAEGPATVQIAGTIKVEPASIAITNRRRPHSILVTGTAADGRTVDLTSQAVFKSADEKIAAADLLGWIHGKSNGQTTVTITAAGKTAAVKIDVRLPATAAPHSFRHDVMPVLSKQSCNMGACHGYSLGKNGFKLSLRGADADKDYIALTREFLGRRINRHRPDASLLLTKPLGDLPHNGGVRLEAGSLQHRLLLNWIAEGSPSDLEGPVHLESIHVYPKNLVLSPGMQHQLQMIARYSDGSQRDVTRLAIFTSNKDRFAAVDDVGLVTAGDLGETAVAVRFERKFATTNIIVLQPRPDFKPTPIPQDNAIDRHVIAKLNTLNIQPSPIAGDAEFLRRVYIDLIGLQPKPDEVRTFLADADPNKRHKVVDALMQREEFVDLWSLKWGDLLQNSRGRLSNEATYAFREWIRGAVASNMPLDEFTRQIVTSRGGPQDDPTSAYYLISVDANDTLQRATQVFCGVRMLCAKCHPHPFENWTQKDYYGLASFFNQVTSKKDPLFPKDAKAKIVTLNLAAGSATNPRTARPQPPLFLGGVEPKIANDTDRRTVYAQWLTSPENPFFARSLVNRYWSYFFNRGIIDPVDDMRSTNPPINPELLDALTKDFVAHKFDVRHLMRTIATSRTYQRSGTPNETNAHDQANFSRAIPRRLPAETLLDCIVQATGVPERFSGVPAGFTAKQLPDGQVPHQLLDLFGKPSRAEACECERDDGSNMLQALHFINSRTFLDRVTAANSRVALLMKQKLDDRQLVEELTLWSLARLPNEKETEALTAYLKSQGDKRAEAAQDILWALLNSKDFMLVR